MTYKLTKEAENRIVMELSEYEPTIPAENVCTYLEEAANHDLERKGLIELQAGGLLIKVDCMDFIKENFT